MKRLSVVLPMMLVLCSCSQSHRRHMGAWEVIEVGDYIVWEFNKNGKAKITTPGGVYPGEYIIDHSKVPIRLDITYDNKTTKCILEFIDKDHFRVIGTDQPGELRPLEFKPKDDIVVLRRIKKKQR